MVKGIDEDEVLSPAPLTVVLSRARLSPQAETSGERVVEPGTLGRREAKVASGLRTAPIWKCKSFPSEVNERQLMEWHQMYRIPDDIEFIVPGPNDRADDPPLGCVALNQAVLAARLRLSFPRIVRKFLREWRIALSQLCPNGWRIMIGLLILWDQLDFPRPSVREFNSLYSFKSDEKRSGWWYVSVKAKTRGSVITQTPDSIKNWKKFWFFICGPWQFTTNDARPNVNIPVRYHELRYVSQEPTEESSERARRARDISENLRSISVLITEENLISARLSPSLSDRPIAHQPRGDMKDISALLKKKTQTQARKGKRKVPAGDQEHSTRSMMEPELPPRPDHSPARSVE
ncbi:Plus3 domain-containing protein [Abeliophyllum distichum]|uniref:Plus3 domain-containing protein n=1 Tax=Abeliophyllum distichum TaxID=126358 RepID=A0ABD1SUN7_9LAMI